MTCDLRNTTGGMILVDAATGETLWELQVPTSHVHGGLCGEIPIEATKCAFCTSELTAST